MTRHKHVISTRVFSLTLVVAATTVGTAFALPADNGGANYYFTQWDYFTDINDASTPGGPGTSLWYTEDIDGTAGADWVDSSTGTGTSTTGGLSNGGQGLILDEVGDEVNSGGSGGTAWPNAESTGVGMTVASGFMWQSKAWVGGAGDTLSFYISPADSDSYFELQISATGQSVTGIGPIGAAGPYDNTTPTSELEEPFWQVNYTPADGGYHVWRNYELLTNTILNTALPTQAGENEMTVSLAAGTLAEVDYFSFDNQSFLPDHSYGRFGYPAGTECSDAAECITIVPEASALVLAGIGLLGLCARTRRRRMEV